jgi:hypothetical protein
MKTNPSIQFRSALLALLVTTVPLTVTASQDALAAAMEQARTDFVQTGNQLQATVKSLSDLAHQEKGDLKPAFDAFSANLDATEKSGKAAADRATALAAAAKDYFGTWQNDVNAISNPELKASAVKRMAAAQKNYDRLTEAGRSVAEQFKPLLSDLRDIKVTLANDLTAGGMKAVKPIADRATHQMHALHGETNDLLNVISDIRKSLSSSVGQ